MNPPEKSLLSFERQLVNFRFSYDDKKFLMDLVEFAFYLKTDAPELPQKCHDGLFRTRTEPHKEVQSAFGYLWHAFFLSALLRELSWRYFDKLDEKRDQEWYLERIQEFSRKEVIDVIREYGLLLDPVDLSEEEVSYSRNLAKWLTMWFFEQEIPEYSAASPSSSQKTKGTKGDADDDHSPHLKRECDLPKILQEYKTSNDWRASLEEE
jgi:hypothetical protein